MAKCQFNSCLTLHPWNIECVNYKTNKGQRL